MTGKRFSKPLCWLTCSLILLAGWADAQTTPPSQYKLNVAVDEVSLTFRAAGAHNLPIKDLLLSELSILDNGQPPSRILSFQSQQDFPIRAGILIDTSESVQENLSRAQSIATKYAQHLSLQQANQAFIMDFGYISKVIQPWTSDPTALTTGIRSVMAGKQNMIGGTGLFNSIYRACFYEFGNIDHTASANLILLFSDGEDNASHTSLQDVINICQRANTAVYVFRPETQRGASTGPGTLAELASETGGRVFFDDAPQAIIENDLRTIEADLQSQYLLVYKPTDFRHDGSFHHIELKTPERVENVSVRSGYYAPVH